MRAPFSLLLPGFASLMGGCAALPLFQEGTPEMCQVAVEEKFGQAVFKPNSLSGAAGPLAGAGKGALDGLLIGGPWGAILTVPIGAILGAGHGTVCAAASSEFPDAEADFLRILAQADTGLVKRELEAQLKPPPARCLRPDPIPPRAVITIESIEAGMGCLHGNQDFWVTVRWRAATTGGRAGGAATTTRSHTTSRSVADWFAHPAEARSDIESVFTGLGKSMAMQLVGKSEAQR